MPTPVPFSLDATDIDNLRKAKFVAAGLTEYTSRRDLDFSKVLVVFNIYQVKRKSLCFVRLTIGALGHDEDVWDARADTWKEAIQQLLNKLNTEVADRIKGIGADLATKEKEIATLENRLERLKLLV